MNIFWGVKKINPPELTASQLYDVIKNIKYTDLTQASSKVFFNIFYL